MLNIMFRAEKCGQRVYLFVFTKFLYLWNGLKRYISYFYQVLKGQWSYNHTPTYFSPLWIVDFFPLNLRRQISLNCHNLVSFLH